MDGAGDLGFVTADTLDLLVRRGDDRVRGRRVELRDGRLVEMSPQFVPHARVKMAVFRALERALAQVGADLEVLVEASVRFADDFVPIPDLCVCLRVDAAGAMPGDAVQLVVEVSQGTLRDDMGAKKTTYARAGVPEYWVFDVEGRNAHRFTAPRDGAYGDVAVFRFDDTLESRSPVPLRFRIEV